MEQLTTKYISPDDFKETFGIDLQAELKDAGELGHRPENFLKLIEDRLETFLDAQFYRQIDKEYPLFTDYQKKHYKRALLEQALYVFRNGDISSDSGYSEERGKIIDRMYIEELSISPNTKQELLLCGLWTRKIKNKRYPSRFGGWIL